MGGDGAASSMANKCRRLNPSSLPPPTGSDFKDSLLESFLLSSHLLELPLEKLLESTPSISERESLIDRALSRGTALIQAAEHCIRKKATAHDYRVWNLPDELTVKIFSMLDVESLCRAGASCTLFCKCHMDPLCYIDIDLRVAVPKVSDEVVSTMLQRAVGALRSLKLGIRPRKYEFSDFSSSRVSRREEMLSQKKISYLTGDCFYSLARNKSNCRLLRTLHLHHFNQMNEVPVRYLLSLCPLLLDLEIVGLGRIEAGTIMDVVSKYCRSLKRLFFEDSRRLMGYDSSLTPSACTDFVKKCQSLTSLSIRRCRLDDTSAEILFKGFKRLKHLDFTRCPGLTRTFLRDPILCLAPVEVLILRNCTHLREDEVNWFLDSVCRGDFACLRLIDLWIDESLRSEDLGWSPDYSVSRTLLKHMAELRPDITLVANFQSNEPSSLQSDEWSDNSTDSSMFSSDSSPSSSHGDEGSNHTIDSFKISSDGSSSSGHGGGEDGSNE